MLKLLFEDLVIIKGNFKLVPFWRKGKWVEKKKNPFIYEFNFKIKYYFLLVILLFLVLIKYLNR